MVLITIALAIVGVVAVGAIAVGSWLLFEPLRKTEEAEGEQAAPLLEEASLLRS